VVAALTQPLARQRRRSLWSGQRGTPTGRQPDRCHQPLAVNEGTVGRSKISQPHASIGDVKPSMLHRDMGIVDHQVTGARSPEDKWSRTDLYRLRRPLAARRR
jgi:hypothetical protein